MCWPVKPNSPADTVAVAGETSTQGSAKVILAQFCDVFPKGRSLAEWNRQV
jgi:hypothetical protein